MYLNYNKKRKFNELVGSNKNDIYQMLKFTKYNKKKNGDSGDGYGEGEGEGEGEGNGDGEDGGNGNPLSIPGLFDKQDDKYIYLKDNHLYFHTEVTEESVDEVKKLMRNYWNKFNKITKSHSCIEFKPKPLYLHIFSPGGCVYSGLSLYDFVLEYKNKIPVYTVVEGMAASAATFISIAGTKRYMTPNSYMLIHQLSTFIGGNFEQVKDGFDNSKKSMDKIMKIYKSHTKINKKKLSSILKHDLNLDANECLVNGLIDEIKLIDVFNDDI